MLMPSVTCRTYHKLPQDEKNQHRSLARQTIIVLPKVLETDLNERRVGKGVKQNCFKVCCAARLHFLDRRIEKSVSPAPAAFPEKGPISSFSGFLQ